MLQLSKNPGVNVLPFYQMENCVTVQKGEQVIKCYSLNW